MPQTGSRSRNFLQASAMLAVATIPLVLAADRASLAPRLSAQEALPGRSESGDMECVSYCSTIRPGTSLMEVKWRLAQGALSVADVRARARAQGLEATVYSEGFAQGLYVVVPSVQPKALFRRPAGREAAPAGPPPTRRLTGLDKLVVTDVATRLDGAARSLRLMQPRPESATGAEEWITARVEGLNPGMEYTYRATGGSSVVTCQAIVCPVDRIRAPSQPKSPPVR